MKYAGLKAQNRAEFHDRKERQRNVKYYVEIDGEMEEIDIKAHDAKVREATVKECIKIFETFTDMFENYFSKEVD